MNTHKNEPPGWLMMGLAARNNLLMAGAAENSSAGPRTTDKPSSLVRPDCESEHLDGPSQVHSFALTTYETGSGSGVAGPALKYQSRWGGGGIRGRLPKAPDQ